jgi:riboflavin kinase/FMN adenylyltransferase
MVISDLNNIKKDNNTTLTVGTFDGIHLGHKKIISTLVALAKQNSRRSLVITFEPHPRTVLDANNSIKIITSLDEKIELIRQLGVDNLLVINFTKEFAHLTSDEFFREIVINKVGVKEIIIGHDHKFGRDRIGNESKIRELSSKFNFTVTPVEPVTYENIIISSTKIRNYLSTGEISSANKLLGRAFVYRGKVVLGNKRGRTIGFPTANLASINKFKILPAAGVYAVKVLWNSCWYNGMMNIGMRPTFNDFNEIITEVNIFDFDKDIYGEILTVEILFMLREEKKFSSVNELTAQIRMDKETSIKILNN